MLPNNGKKAHIGNLAKNGFDKTTFNGGAIWDIIIVSLLQDKWNYLIGLAN